MQTNCLSPLAERMLSALWNLKHENNEHACGGFSLDDITWRMRVMLPPTALFEAMDELRAAGLADFAGWDAQEDEVCCYRAAPQTP